MKYTTLGPWTLSICPHCREKLLISRCGDEGIDLTLNAHLWDDADCCHAEATKPSLAETFAKLAELMGERYEQQVGLLWGDPGP